MGASAGRRIGMNMRRKACFQCGTWLCEMLAAAHRLTSFHLFYVLWDNGDITDASTPDTAASDRVVGCPLTGISLISSQVEKPPPRRRVRIRRFPVRGTSLPCWPCRTVTSQIQAVIRRLPGCEKSGNLRVGFPSKAVPSLGPAGEKQLWSVS